MYAKIGRGDRTAGLMVYLAGPGRANEHTEPHLVAGDSSMMTWHDDAELQRESALNIARHLDRPRRLFEVEVTGGHVWHCSLSLRAEEGQLTDDKWREISEAFVDRMGFGTHEDTKAPTRWVAVRHGLSANGNDHVHLVVNLVREDGTKASVHNDRIKARDLCRELEEEFDLEPLERDRDTAAVPFKQGEREAVARRQARGRFETERRAGTETRTWSSLTVAERQALYDAQLERVAPSWSARHANGDVRPDQPRWDLARRVRGCATASLDEAEFVRRLRQHDVLVRPRFADGRDDVVVGYSVASRPSVGERPIWYGGGHLGKDLALPRLRSQWHDGIAGVAPSDGSGDGTGDGRRPSTRASAEAAVREWTAARRGRRVVAPGREHIDPSAEVHQQLGQDLHQLREQLRTVPFDDHDAWAHVARQAAGTFAAWSTSVETTPGPLAAAADALARSAETSRAPAPRPARAPLPSVTGTAYLMLAAAKPGVAGQLAVLKELVNLAEALRDMHAAAGSVRRANHLEQTLRNDLAGVGQRLQATAAAPAQDAGTSTSTSTITTTRSTWNWCSWSTWSS